MNYLTELRWSPYLVGAGIGILSWFSFLFAKQPISCSTSFARTSGMIERVLRGKKVQEKAYYQKFKLIVDWQWMLVVGIVIGSFLSALLSGDLHLQWVPDLWQSAFGGNPLLRMIAAMIGGIFLGFGARWANGCTSGHGISGTLQLAVSSWISAICFFIGGILAAYFIYHIIA
ncbi:MAG TPA: YeeE/YedE thiosulfate transporter family protein [bacterium]|nr:YeeE/YedE thiosulfate transporter family protein [bacterium]HNT67044.1 YeeE/YedE thiosulfate transporter family protein [bacterium]HOX86767.1 YeeE/YedE thiosulfate transporter family protein [bacterium]HPG46922.1 YeeE/YedE thiosulfate transporter family protein [bacterium]HPM99286.1 YeeE/YedE thiosulfate transporter family protein [bacterium]